MSDEAELRAALRQAPMPELSDEQIAAVVRRGRRVRTQRALAAGVLIVLAAALAGFIAPRFIAQPSVLGSPASSSPTAIATNPVSPSSPATSAPPSSAEGVSIVAVRIGANTGFDRIVVDLTGPPAANVDWTAEWVTEAHVQSSGLPIDLPTTSIVKITIRGLAEPASSDMPLGFQETSVGAIREVYIDPIHEGTAVIYVSVDSERPLRTSTLDQRLIIDLAG